VKCDTSTLAELRANIYAALLVVVVITAGAFFVMAVL